MTTAFWCVLAVAGLTYLCTGVAKVGGRMPPRANHSPRDWLDKLQGWPKRAHFAQHYVQDGFTFYTPATTANTGRFSGRQIDCDGGAASGEIQSAAVAVDRAGNGGCAGRKGEDVSRRTANQVFDAGE